MTLSVQFYTLLAMIGMGSLFGAMLDTYQRFLQRNRRKRWIVFLNDLLFWLIQGILVFYVLFIVNFGELRFYLFLALLCGFSAYQALFRNLYINLLEQLIRLAKMAMKLLYRTIYLLIYQPIKGLYLMLAAIIFYLYGLLMTLVKIVWIVIKWAVRTVLKPFSWILKKTIPKSARKFFGKMKTSMAGFFKETKNTMMKVIQYLWRKR